MKLMTKKLEKRFAKVGKQGSLGEASRCRTTKADPEEDVIVVAKFWSLASGWTWYATEYYPEDKMFFGLVDGFELELGYFSLAELESVKWCGIQGIERDMYFEETTLAKVRADCENMRGYNA